MAKERSRGRSVRHLIAPFKRRSASSPYPYWRRGRRGPVAIQHWEHNMKRLLMAVAAVALFTAAGVTGAAAQNRTVISQFGTDNGAAAAQQGERNQANVDQRGRSHYSRAVQYGRDNFLRMNQGGTRNEAVTEQNGDNNLAVTGQE